MERRAARAVPPRTPTCCSIPPPETTTRSSLRWRNRPWPSGVSRHHAADRSAGESNYHALETAFTKRMSNRWQASATYTLSKFTDYIPPPLSGNTLVHLQGARGYRGFLVSRPRRPAPPGGVQCGLRAAVRLPVERPVLLRLGPGLRRQLRRRPPQQRQSLVALRPDGTIVPRNNSGRLSDKTGTYGDPIHRMDLRVLRRFKLDRALDNGRLVRDVQRLQSCELRQLRHLRGKPALRQPQQNFNAAYLPRMLQLGFRVAF